ncbi:6901_t:CDS:1, partial [Paraglomus occultum]
AKADDGASIRKSDKGTLKRHVRRTATLAEAASFLRVYHNNGDDTSLDNYKKVLPQIPTNILHGIISTLYEKRRADGFNNFVDSIQTYESLDYTHFGIIITNIALLRAIS